MMAMEPPGAAPAGDWPFGAWLRDAREKAGLTQNAAAERAVVSRTTWQQLESGQRSDRKPVSPMARTVIEVAAAVGADPVQGLTLLGLDPTTFEPGRRPGRRSPSEAELLHGFSRLTTRQKTAIVELVNSMLPENAGEYIVGTVPRAGVPTVSELSRTQVKDNENNAG